MSAPKGNQNAKGNKGGGRKTSYKPEYAEQAQKLCAIAGFTDQMLAESLPMFRDAYAQRRCIVPVDGFFEWRAIKGARAKQALRHCREGRLTFRPSGLVGELAQSEHRRMGAHLRHYHGAFQPTGGSNP
jgi:putative SOS response-associated peptidase YedK